MLRDPFLASGACEFLLLFAAGKASSIQCLQPWHSAAALWPVRDGLHATLSQRRYINWSHRCETSHPVSIAIPFILTLSIHRNVHYSLLMSPVHGVFCVFWQGGRTSPAIEDGSSDFKAGATSGPCASAVMAVNWHLLLAYVHPRNLCQGTSYNTFLSFWGVHGFTWVFMEYSRWKPKGVISPWKMILQIAFSPHQSIKTMHTAIQHLKKKHLSCSFWGCQKVAGWKNEHLSPWGRRTIKKPDASAQGPGRSKRCVESWGKNWSCSC